MISALALAVAGVTPATVAMAQTQDPTVDQFVFYFNGTVSTNGPAMGGFAPTSSGSFFTAGFSGSGQALRAITNVPPWTGDSYVGQTDWLKLLLTDNISTGNIPGANTATNPTVGNIQLNPTTITVGGITYAPGTLAFMIDGAKTSVSGTVSPTLSKLVYAYDLRKVSYDGLGNPNGVAAPGTRDYNNDGIIQWNDVFYPIATFNDQKLLNPGQTSTSNNVARRFTFSSDGQSMYFNDSAAAYGGIYKVNLTSVGSMTKLLTSSQVNTEPTVVHTSVRDFGGGFGAGDQVIFEGGSDIGNNGGLSFVVDNGTSVSSVKTILTSRQLSGFFDVAGASADFRGVASDTSGNLYLMNVGSPAGLYLYDTQGRLVKVNSAAEQRVFDANQGVSYNINQLDTIVRTSPVNPAVREVLYNDSSLRAPTGVTVYMPGDFNRDNIVDAADVTLLKYVLNGQDPFNIAHPALSGGANSLRGSVIASIGTSSPFTQTNTQVLRFDLNGSFTSGSTAAVSVDWKDVKIFQQFAGLSDGDVNMDYFVDSTDLATIGANYGGTGKTFLQGNLTSVRVAATDKDDVNFADLVTLAANWPIAKPALAAVGSISSTDIDRAFAITANGTISQYKGAANGTWGGTVNWVNGVVPDAPGAVADLLTKAKDDVSLTVDGSYTLGQLNFDNFFTYTLGGPGSLHFNGNGMTAEINCFAASPSIGMPVEMLGSTNVNVTYAADTLTLSGAISGGGGTFGKLGAGTLLLTGPNGYSGNTVVGAGTLQAQKWFSLSGYNTPGNVTVNSGATLAANSGGTNEWTTQQIDTLRANVTFNAGSALGIDTTDHVSTDLRYASNIAGNLGVTKLGSNTLILAGTNSYTGQTSVSAGTLQAINGAALSGYTIGGKVSVASGATLSVNAGGGSDWTSGQIDILRANASFASGSALGINTSNGSFTYGSVISGSGVGLTKLGANTLSLTGQSTYTGPTTVNAGTLNLNFAGASAASNLVSSSSVLQLSGGTLALTGKASTANSQTFASTTVNPGGSGIALTAATSNPLLLALGAITRNTGSTVDFTLPSGTQSATNGVTTSSSVSNLILGGYITVGQTDWAAKSTNNIIPLASGSYVNDTWASANNTTVTTSSAPAASSTTNSLRFNSNAGAFTVTLSGTNTITSGGVLVTPNVGNNLQTITGGTLIGRAGADLVIHQHNTASGLNIASGIADNTSATGLTKTGAGTATLSGPLSYTGGTFINNGKLSLQTNLVTTSALNVTGGTLELATGGGHNRVIRAASVSASGTGKIDIQDNKIITSTPVGVWDGGAYSGVTGLIANGYTANQDFSGTTGIVTSQSAATGGNTLTCVGVASNADLGKTTFAGQSVTASDTLLMYTYGGDANLDGAVTGDDYFQIDSAFPQALHGWFNGDFNYDGAVTGDDYFIIDSNFPAQGTAFPTGSGIAGVVAVPEPASIAIVTVGATALLRRKRRHG